jgi:hypothetical protein
MDETTFWAIIDRVDRSRIVEDDEAAVEPIIAVLSALGPVEIASFEEHLARRLHDLDGRSHADEAGESSGSADAFLYARCFVIAQGEAHFRKVLADPSRMPKSSDEWCEALLGVAASAHENATGKPATFEARICYETGSNRARWK